MLIAKEYKKLILLKRMQLELRKRYDTKIMFIFYATTNINTTEHNPNWPKVDFIQYIKPSF